MIVEKEEYADRLGGYIERNPMRAGLVKDPGEWKWSSYRFYAYGEQMQAMVEWNGKKVMVNLIDEDPMYKHLGETNSERQKNYREIVFRLDDSKAKEELGLAKKRRVRTRQKDR
jgi:putative transposase